MLVKSITEEEIYGIGHAFGFYDYGEETGMTAAFSGREATADYICAYVRGMLRGGFLHTTSERSEGYIAYKLPKREAGLSNAVAHRERNAAQFYAKTAPALRYGYQTRRRVAPGSHG